MARITGAAHSLITLLQQPVTLWKTLGSWGGACNAERIPRCVLQGRASNHVVCSFCIASPAHTKSLLQKRWANCYTHECKTQSALVRASAATGAATNCLDQSVGSQAQYSAERGIQFEPDAGIWRPWENTPCTHTCESHRCAPHHAERSLEAPCPPSCMRPCAAWLLKSVPWPGILRRLWVRHTLVPVLMCAAGLDLKPFIPGVVGAFMPSFTLHYVHCTSLAHVVAINIV